MTLNVKIILCRAHSVLALLGKLTYHAAMTHPRDIGARIRTAREEQGWTQDQLAEAVGVSRSAVAQWETGRAGQVTTNLTRVATALGVGVEHLMYGHENLAPGQPRTGDEIAILRLYRECTPEDRQLLLRTARRLARASTGLSVSATPPPLRRSRRRRAAPAASPPDSSG
jgi:transcriptional regulator with XRE-family HTH domain